MPIQQPLILCGKAAIVLINVQELLGSVAEMCEAAAQMCGYYYVTQKIGDAGVLLGLAGIDEARFIRTVRPGERLVMVGTGIKIHRRLTRFRVVGQVGTEKAFEAVITGVPLGKLEELRGA